MKKMLSVLLALVTLALPTVFSALAQADEADLEWNDFLQAQYYDEVGYDIAVNPCGNTPCVTGMTLAEDFPTTSGAFDTTYYWYSVDVFVTKFNSTGNKLIYSTFLGGREKDIAYGIAMDDSGNVYVTGETRSNNFPVTDGAFDVTYNTSGDAFIAKLNITGSSLLYSTFLGGDESERGYSIDIDDLGNAYVTGQTTSFDFPTTSGAFDTTFNARNDVFVAKLNPTGSALAYGTFLGGDLQEKAYGISVDNEHSIYVTGYSTSETFPVTSNSIDTTHNGEQDVFVTKINPDGRSLAFSTFLGGTQGDIAHDIAIDRFGIVYVLGQTKSSNFPTTSETFDNTQNGDGDVFIAKISPSSKELIYSTFLGGSKQDAGQNLALDNAGFAYVTGYTFSSDFPSTDRAFDPTYNGSDNAFICKLTPSGRALSFSSFLGGASRGFGIDVDQYGNAYVTGVTSSWNFPTTPGAFDTQLDGWDDVFVSKFDAAGSHLVFSTFLGGSRPPQDVSESPMTELPNCCALHQNYPNPFNAGTEIRYQLPQDNHVTLKVFNTLGQRVRILVDGEQRAGESSVAWDGRDDRDREVSSGMYFCRLKAGDFSKTIKMMLVR